MDTEARGKVATSKTTLGIVQKRNVEESFADSGVSAAIILVVGSAYTSNDAL
jgi:hypothetical protein